jgi:hypothetical protein
MIRLKLLIKTGNPGVEPRSLLVSLKHSTIELIALNY